MSRRLRRAVGTQWVPVLLTFLGLAFEAVLAVSPRPDVLGSWVVFLDDRDCDGDGEEAPAEIVDLERTWPQARVVARTARRRGQAGASPLDGDVSAVLREDWTRLQRPRHRPGLGLASKPGGLPIALCRLTC